MASKRNRKVKSILNQTSAVEPLEEVKEVPEPKITISGTEIIAQTLKENVEIPVIQKEEEEIIEEAPVVMGVSEDEVLIHSDSFIEEDKEEEKPPRTLQSLSKAELRWFQRTGMMPK